MRIRIRKILLCLCLCFCFWVSLGWALEDKEILEIITNKNKVYNQGVYEFWFLQPYKDFSGFMSINTHGDLVVENFISYEIFEGFIYIEGNVVKFFFETGPVTEHIFHILVLDHLERLIPINRDTLVFK